MAADGSIIIDTKINTDGMEQAPKDMKKQFAEISQAAKNTSTEVNKAMNGAASGSAPLKNSINELETKIADLKNKMDTLETAKLPTEDYAYYSLELEKANKKLEDLLYRQARMKETGSINKNSQAWKNLQYDIARTQSLIRDCQANLKYLENTGKAFTMGHATQQAAQMKEQLLVAQDQLRRLKAQARGLSVKNFLTGLKDAAKTITGKIAGGLKSAISAVGRLAKNAKASQSPFNKLGESIKKIVPAMMAAQGVIGIFRKAVTNLMSTNETLSAQMQSIWDSLSALIEPIVSRVVSMLQLVVGYLTQFLALLGIVGSSTSKQIEDSGSSASKATDKLKKQLASFDEINTLSTDSSDDSGGGGGAAAAAVSVTPELPDWASLIVEQLKAGNFEEVGAILSQKIAGALGGINWKNIQTKAAGIAAGIALFLNGALASPTLWDATGMTLAEGLNTITYTLYSFFTTLDWAGIGSSFASGLNTFVSTIDWSTAGATVSNGIKGLLTFMVKAIEDTNWQELGKKVGEFLAAIDWNGIISLMFEGIGAAIGGLGAFLVGLISGAMDDLKEWWYENAFENGEFSILGLLEGILNALKSIGQWIVNNIFLPIWNGIKKAFDINSPSKKLREIGVFIIQGLLNGITSLISKVIGKFTEIKSKVIEIFTKLKTALKTPINGIIGFINGLVSSVVSGINGIISMLNKLSFTLPDWLEHVPGASSLAGKTLGFNINTITAPQIPYLAKGAVIPPNAPFAAVLGDQKHGTNIEAPLSTIQEALANVLSTQGDREVNVNISYSGDLAQLGRVLQPVIEVEENRKGPTFAKGAVLA